MVRRTTLTVALVAYLCLFFTGGPFTLAAFAKITMKPTDEDVKIITIEKGDTLWDLAAEYLKEPTRWPWFKEYNEYTNPDLIYPGEKMQIPLKWLEGMLEAERAREVQMASALQALQEQYQENLKQLEMAKAELEDMRVLLQNLKSQNAALEKALASRDDELRSLREILSDARDTLGDEFEDLRARLDGMVTNREFRRQLREMNKQLTDRIEAMEKALDQRSKQVEQVQARGVSLETQVQQLQAQLMQTQEMITALKERIAKAEGVVEKTSANKKLFAFLTAVAGGIVWVAVNSLSHAD